MDELLGKAIAAEIAALETDEEIVVCTANPARIVQRLSDAVLAVVPQTGLTPTELHAVRRLIFHAINDPNFFDWEMPTLTGFSAERFGAIVEKLPHD